MNKGVQHSKSQAEAMVLRGVGERTLHRSEDVLNREQMVLFARMRDEGAKIVLTGALGAEPNDPTALQSFVGAKLAQGREINRAPKFDKMPLVARTTAMRSIAGGHVAWVSSHTDNNHHFYGLSERGMALLAAQQTARRQVTSARPVAKPAA